MKLDPIFTVKNKKLYTISDNSEVDTATLKRIDILWSTVELDEERKAAMVSNLLVVLCGNHDAQPVVNSGSLY